MVRQMFAGITLLAFVNLLMGCTTTEKVPVEGLGRDKEKITELVLTDGTVVRFGPDGGRFQPPRAVIRGKSLEGKPLIVEVDEQTECRITPPRSLAIQELGSARIIEVVLRSNLLKTFEEPGARYDSTVGKIRGKVLGGEMVSYTLGAVRSFRSEKPTSVSVGELNRLPQQPVYEVIGNENVVRTFDSTGGQVEKHPPAFAGMNVNRQLVEVPSDDVLYATISRPNAAGTVLATLGVIVGIGLVVFLIALATKQSCPFIYSFNGDQYIFDAEPLGGAICPGLARTDVSRLDYVKSVDGEYRLLIRNEVPETQYLDQMKLLVVDHSPDAKVFPDLQGRFYAFRGVQGVTSAFDEKGMSLMNFLRASDNVTWQTHLPSASKETNGSVRHELTIALPKPVGAKKAWLVTNIGTSSWGSNMIRKTVEYRGNTAESWLKSVVPGSQSYTEMYQFIEREEMYHLNVWVKEGESWKQEGVILGQGPLISEDRVYPIDVSNVAGDSLMLRFNPPKGFWTMDYVGVSFEDPVEIHPTRVDALRAKDQRGNSILGPLDQADRGYYTMPEIGDWAEVTFRAPVQTNGTMRSVYLETGGYYDLHLPQGQPDQLARLYDIWMNPGHIVKATMEEFRSWQADQQAAAGRSHHE